MGRTSTSNVREHSGMTQRGKEQGSLDAKLEEVKEGLTKGRPGGGGKKESTGTSTKQRKYADDFLEGGET